MVNTKNLIIKSKSGEDISENDYIESLKVFGKFLHKSKNTPLTKCKKINELLAEYKETERDANILTVISDEILYDFLEKANYVISRDVFEASSPEKLNNFLSTYQAEEIICFIDLNFQNVLIKDLIGNLNIKASYICIKINEELEKSFKAIIFYI
ncbi:MAG: hypothetical protein M0R51_04275 [Clostridia bacterium]|nr:hypothetical protein [Clostridia bacterium]